MYCSSRCRQKGFRKRQKISRERYRKALQQNILRLNHRTVDWHTPVEYISAVREVLGEIGLDPASCEVANQTVKALRYFDKETNGLQQEWRGSVYLNPPHDRVYPIGPWITKLLQEHQAGHVESALLLVDAATSAAWFQPLYAYPMCFVQGRIAFVSGDGKKSSQPINGSVFVYLGKEMSTFARIFGQFGKVFLP
jgi:ParB family transcriptional regulator, chromosome partitioning protein